jgi:uncharacterized Fe-S cluster-containing MiaB family protein
MKEIHLSDCINKYFKFTKLIILSNRAKNTLEKDDGILLKVFIMLILVFANLLGK